MRIYPIHTPASAPNLVRAEIIPPADIPGSEDKTQYLMFDKKVDIIAISQTTAMLDSGVMDVTDMLDEHARINKIAYSVPIKNSKTGSRQVKYLDVSHMSGAAFVRTQEGNYREIRVKLKTPLEGGVFQMEGSLSLDLGTLWVVGHVDKTEVELIGFELEAYRFNPNRRNRDEPGYTNSTLQGWPSGNNDGRGRPRKERPSVRDREAED